MPVDNVTENAVSHLVTHNKNNSAIPIFATPTWSTTAWDSTSDRAANTATIYFSTPAPSGAKLFWRTAG
jgi:hypothetical protein